MPSALGLPAHHALESQLHVTTSQREPLEANGAGQARQVLALVLEAVVDQRRGLGRAERRGRMPGTATRAQHRRRHHEQEGGCMAAA